MVGADGWVSFRNVKVGPRVDSLWVIVVGLKPGDKVLVELSPYDLTRGRITYRLR